MPDRLWSPPTPGRLMERLDRFMARANAEYYATHDPFADFATAPEISQAFGEILGLWAAVVWQTAGRPDPVILAEAGPGRGTLMQDALRAIGRMAPDFRAALKLHLIETSPRLRALQRQKLPGATWHETIGGLPPGPLLLIGNEFLDALPVRQFVRRGQGWTERFVQDGALVEQPAEAPSLPTLTAPVPDGAVIEIGEAARSVASLLGGRLTRQGGAALFLDYGPERSAPGDSLQALRQARPADPLAGPGSADLTAHVDFQAFAHAARAAGATVYGPVPQGPFLARLGLFQRSERLTRGQNPATVMAILEATRRLTEPDRMGR
ncbi:MAG: SAM-dependent methyltransferase, partial [Acetobacteraceae bacterium]|nr:SAM-dependent methyltransferase [Acetobacteraceae bacterium]